MIVIGITGSSGSGKTSALMALKELGACILDCDEIYHQLLQTSAEMLDELDAAFPGVVTQGKLDRPALARIVFEEPSLLQCLNHITHRYILKQVQRRMDDARQAGIAVCAVDAALLVQSGFSALCDVVVGIVARRETRMARIMRRDGLSREQAIARIHAQPDDDFYHRNCDYVLCNDGENMDGFVQSCRVFFGDLIRRNQNGR